MKRNYSWFDEYYRVTPLRQIPWGSLSPSEDLTDVVKKTTLSGGTALDVGCGIGRNGFLLERLGFRVVGVDIAPAALRLAFIRSVFLNAKIALVVADVTRFPFQNSGFEFVIDIACFHCLYPEDRHSYIEEIVRVTREGGYYFLRTFHPQHRIVKAGLEGCPVKFFGFTQQDIIKLFEHDFEPLHSWELAYEGALNRFQNVLFRRI